MSRYERAGSVVPVNSDGITRARSRRGSGNGVAFGDNDDAAVSDGKARAVAVEVVADLRAVGDVHAIVDDGAANSGVTADLHVAEDQT